ncbi:hypothetical protein XI00_06530 [Bradyrhizobium sp. CCBAU 21359]|nr:hypothetical protein [Bradyrhizobium sp. CCBAU 21359]
MHTACQCDRRLALMEIADRGLIIAQAGTFLWRTNSLLRDEASTSLVLDARDWSEPHIGRVTASADRGRVNGVVLASRRM